MAAPNEQGVVVEDVSEIPPHDEPPTSPFNTLWTEFARSRPRISPPRSPSTSVLRRPRSVEPTLISNRSRIDLRALEYTSDYDSNLMCPICHIPFIEPVALDCDHTFCEGCFDHYAAGKSSTDRSKCPTCRSYHLGRARKASRLIKNMCNDIQVHCPNKACKVVIARGCIEQHITNECPEEELSCSDGKCTERTRRKNFVPGQCIHKNHVECECGATIQLGRGAWTRHKDQDCPITHISAMAQDNAQSSTNNEPCCPGAQFGCTESLTSDTIDAHTTSCPFGRLAPYLKKQSLLLKSAQEQLTMAKLRNEALETSFSRLEDLITLTVQPKLDRLLTLNTKTTAADPDDNASVSDIEEIPRTDLYTSSSSPGQQSLETFPPVHATTIEAFNHTDLLGQSAHSQYDTAQNNQRFDPITSHLLSSTSAHASHLSSLDQSLQGLTAQLNDLDARSSMALMNETLRIREDLNILNGAMHSTRTQVQWLLNRERILGQREAMMAASATRGRAPPTSSTNNAAEGNTSSITSSESATPTNGAQNSAAPSGGVSAGASMSSSSSGNMQGYQGRSSFDRNMSSAWSISQAANANVGSGCQGQGPSSGHSSAATSPMFGAARPSLRRLSGGSSQERVKL